MSEIRQMTLDELLRDTATVFEQVAAGQNFEITKNGHLIATVLAADAQQRKFRELVEAGIAPPDLLERQRKFMRWLEDNPPLPAEPGQEPLSETIIRMRREERS